MNMSIPAVRLVVLLAVETGHLVGDHLDSAADQAALLWLQFCLEWAAVKNQVHAFQGSG